MKLKALAFAALSLISSAFAPAPARATVLCDQLTGGIGICLPRIGTDFANWSNATRNAFTLVNSSGVINSTASTHIASWLLVNRISGLSTGTAGVWISSATTFTSSVTIANANLSVSYGLIASTVSASSFTASGNGYSIQAAAGNIFSKYGVLAATMTTTSAFIGSTHQTQNVIGSDNSVTVIAGQNSASTYSNANATIQSGAGTGANSSGGNIILQTGLGASAGSGNSGSVLIKLADKPATGVSAIVEISTGNLKVIGNVIASYGFTAATASLTAMDVSTQNVSGYFAAGGSTLVASGGRVAIGTGGIPATKFHMSSGTATLDGTSAELRVQSAANAYGGLSSNNLALTDGAESGFITARAAGGGNSEVPAGIWMAGNNGFSGVLRGGTTPGDKAVLAYYNGSQYAAGLSVPTVSAGVSTMTLMWSGGSVGIGTGTPSALLDVNGNASFGLGAAKSTFSALGSMTVPYEVRAGSFNVAGGFTATSTGTFAPTLGASTVTISQNNALAMPFDNAPVTMYGNVNSHIQAVIQNQSTAAAASANLIVTGALGGNASYYAEVGMNSPTFSDSVYTAQKASGTYLATSDGPLMIWAGLLGNKNTASPNQNIAIGTSHAISSNTAIIIERATDSQVGPVTVFSSFTVTSSTGVRVTSTMTVGGYFSVATSTLSVTGGTIFVPSQPFIEAHGSANQTLSAITTIYFDVNDTITNMAHDVTASSGTFTFPIAGRYDVTACAFANSVTTGEYQFNIHVNSSQKMRNSIQASSILSVNESFCVHKVMTLAASDFITFYMTPPGATTLFSNNGAARTIWTTIYKLP